MATFETTGIDDLMLSMQEVAEIPDEIVDDILAAGAEVVVEAQKKQLTSLGLFSSGKLILSIDWVKKSGDYKGGKRRYVLIYPTGVHHTYATAQKQRQNKGRKSNRYSRKVRNNDIGFILEFGAPNRGIPAHAWMWEANEKSADATTAAELRVYDEFLKSKNL